MGKPLKKWALTYKVRQFHVLICFKKRFSFDEISTVNRREGIVDVASEMSCESLFPLTSFGMLLSWNMIVRNPYGQIVNDSFEKLF